MAVIPQVRVTKDPAALITHIEYIETPERLTSAICDEIIVRITEKFVEEHYAAVMAQLDINAIAKSISDRVSARVVEKMLGSLGGQ